MGNKDNSTTINSPWIWFVASHQPPFQQGHTGPSCSRSSKRSTARHDCAATIAASPRNTDRPFEPQAQTFAEAANIGPEFDDLVSYTHPIVEISCNSRPHLLSHHTTRGCAETASLRRRNCTQASIGSSSSGKATLIPSAQRTQCQPHGWLRQKESLTMSSSRRSTPDESSSDKPSDAGRPTYLCGTNSCRVSAI
ncbi:hypothetical protein TgHK011_004134 [Trichoderma gracile]|nr:hypothetical protein TgHK011_004134 [Trichoderma gracile]